MRTFEQMAPRATRVGLLAALALLYGGCWGSSTTRSGGSRGPTMLPGARALKAFHRTDAYAGYAPDAKLTLGAFDRARGERTSSASVEVFHQRPGPTQGGGFDVERGGELVALALARQLEALGWTVGVEPRADLLTEGIAAYPPLALGGRAVLGFRFRGSVRYWVSPLEGGSGNRSTVEASIAAFPLGRALVSEPAVQGRWRGQGLVRSGEEARRTRRARLAAQRALSELMRAMFRDARLDQGLAVAVGSGR